MNQVLPALARLLPRGDREAVLGDLCESGMTTREALFDLCGLIARRTLQLYAHWRTWIYLAMTLQLSFLLIGISVAFATQICNLSNGDAWIPSLFEISRMGLLLLVSSIVSSVAAASLARAVAVPLALTVLVAALTCIGQFHMAHVPSFSIFLFVPPACFGVWLAVRRPRWSRAGAIAVTLLQMVLLRPFLATDRWMWINNILLILPAAYCSLALSSERQNARS